MRVFLLGALLSMTPFARAGEWDFTSQGELTKDKIEKFLSRAVTHFDTVSFRGFSPAEVDRTREFLLHTGAKFVHGAELSWGKSYPDHSYWDHCRTAIASLHATPGLEDVIFEGFIAEHISSNADNTLIPEWLWNEMEAEGINATRTRSPNDTGDRHYFHYPNFFDADWVFKNHWGPGQSVPDLTKLETQLYFRYLLREHIDAGFESIWFGQLGLTGARDNNSIVLNGLRQFARTWAAQYGYRHAILLTSHVTSRLHDNEQMMDYICFPCRVRYSDRYPHGMEINPGLVGDPGLLTIIQNAVDLPVLLEVDNYACQPNPPITNYGFDEITGFAYKEPWQRRAFLEQYYWELRTYVGKGCNNRVYLALPARRNICLAGCTGRLDTNPNVPYPSGSYSPYSEHCGDEDTIAALFAAPPPPGLSPRNRVSVELGETNVEDGVLPVAVYDGDTAPMIVGGRNCRGPVDPGSDLFMYFNVNDGFTSKGFHSNLFVTIDYYDGAGGPLVLQYDAVDGITYKPAGQIALAGTDTWRQARFHLTDAWFGNRQNEGADFRIANSSGTLFYVSGVSVSLAPKISLGRTTISRILDRGHPAPSDSFSVTHSGSRCTTLDYSVVPGTGWLTVDHSQGTLAAGAQRLLQVGYSVDQLDLGEHASEICVEAPGAIEPHGSAAVRIIVRQRGDQNFDGDVDQEDFGAFQACLTGDGVARTESCILADLDLDGDVDVFDFNLFLPCLSGADQPAEPGC